MAHPMDEESPIYLTGSGDKPCTATLYYGLDVRDGLRKLKSNSIHCLVTSPPFWGLRDYSVEPSVWGGDPTCIHTWKKQKTYKDSPTRTGDEGVGFANAEITKAQRWTEHATCTKCGAWLGCLGLEPEPELYVEHLVEVFREAKRVLRKDGTVWLNLGDSHNGSGGAGGDYNPGGSKAGQPKYPGRKAKGLKPKDLCGIPWRVAMALQADGWWLRMDIIWAKPNSMPEPVKDRPAKAHEYIFLLSRSPHYFCDIRETVGRNRSVWNVNPKGYKGAHFATWPEELVKPMILAGTSERGCCAHCGAPWARILDPPAWQPTCQCATTEGPVPCTVLDIFSGSGTSGLVAMKLGRNYVGLDLNPNYLKLALHRISGLEAPAEPDPEPTAQATIFDLF